MDDTNNPKVSFIPKGSLVRQESFLEQSRPRSVIGFLATLVFISSVGSYAGLYFYEITLTKEVETKTEKIEQVQKTFSDAPEVRRAKLFRARADLARELLSSHTVVSPVLTFLSRNTVATIFYDKFSFLKDANGQQVVEVTGEAMSYAALAYQADVLRLNTKELSGFSIKDVVLTSFGTVKFTLNLVFVPGYLLYEKSTASSNGITSQLAVPVTTPAPFGVQPTATPVATTSATSSLILVEQSVPTTNITVSTDGAATASQVSTSDVLTVPPAQQGQQVSPTSFMKSLWSKFKFW